MGLRRQLAQAVAKLTGVVIIHPGEFHQVTEQIHLRRFLAHFDVDCVWDVGANVGQYATQLRKRVGYKGAIISFEPNPDVADELKQRAAADPLWFVEVVALDREVGPAPFNVMTSNTFSSLHAPASDQPGFFGDKNLVERQLTIMRSTVAVEYPKWQKRLGFKRPFLKMDTQGNDLAVVQGAGDRLNHFVGLQSELAIRKLYDGAPGFAETLAEFAARGFELSAFVPNTAGHFPIMVETDCILFRKGAEPAEYQ